MMMMMMMMTTMMMMMYEQTLPGSLGSELGKKNSNIGVSNLEIYTNSLMNKGQDSVPTFLIPWMPRVIFKPSQLNN